MLVVDITSLATFRMASVPLSHHTLTRSWLEWGRAHATGTPHVADGSRLLLTCTCRKHVPIQEEICAAGQPEALQ